MKRPSIILTSTFTTAVNRKQFGNYLGYMARKEAIEGKKFIGEKELKELNLVEKNLDALNKKYHFTKIHSEENSKRTAEAKEILTEKTFWSLDDTNFGNYLGYMARIQALENKKQEEGGLTKEENKELNRVTTNRDNILNGHATKEKELDATFTIDKDSIQLKDFADIRNTLNQAQEKGSVLWQDVVSFDNDFLKKHNFLDEKTGIVDTVALKKASRKMMSTFQEKMQPPLNEMYWLASIHYNTDNIHLHFATVEKNSRRPIITRDGLEQPKGRRPLSVIDAMKSSFANDLLGTSQLTKELSQERQRIRLTVKESFIQKIDQPDLQTELNNFMQTLTSDRRNWQYNKLSQQQKTMLNNIVDGLLKDSSSFSSWKQKVKKVQENRQDLYGQSQRANKDYEKNQIYGREGIYARCGNVLLTDLKKIDKVANGGKRHRINLKEKVAADQYIQTVLKVIDDEIHGRNVNSSSKRLDKNTKNNLPSKKTMKKSHYYFRLPIINHKQLRKLKSNQELVFYKANVTKEKRVALREYEKIRQAVDYHKTE
ncbi:hypothetical protein DS834_07955 [Lactobacillus bombicola]|uniref:Uncharacterized protein n=1 Tax=Lactobacillus bombicola TaxID=1505723 RepID=A0ABX9LSU0_9LACO|nr:MobP2 family relaxase [Lactobacillus bombicola]RHW49258.1 hypothetical protein DS834_07955 [Lactobacillus bombicola]